MKTWLAGFREAGSFIAGLLIGLSIVDLVFAMSIAVPSDWQMWWVVGAPVILALGFTLQVAVTAKPRHRRTTGQELGALPIGFMELSHER